MRELPEGWIETTLGELAIINPRESIKKGSVAKSVAMEKLPAFDKRITGFELKPFKGGTKFRNGDTLLARITPCLENGKTAYVDILDEGEVAFGSTEYIVIREKEGLGDKQFLFYLATSPRFREIATKCMTGTSGRQRVQTDVLINKPMFLPPLPEQKAIADMLSSFDEKIELLREQNKTLETLAQTIFKEWFVHFNFPVCQGTGRPDQHGLSACGHAQAGKPYRNNGGAMVASELGEIPKGWRVGKLGELIDKVIDNRGKTPPTNEKDSSSYPLVEVNSIIGMNRAINLQSVRKYVSPDTYRSWFRKGHPKKNDVLISTVGSIGELAILNDEKVSIAQNIVALRSHNFGLFLFQLLQQNIRRVKTLDISSVQPSIKVPHMLNMEVVIPIETLRSQFEELIFPISEKVARNVIQINSLSKARDTLLPKLMSGQVRVQSKETLGELCYE